ncbi:polysaccharide lyase family 8 super-sandwich domain-containing protein [Sanguibacter sp. Z1732]|uniref:polysaccharide lyase family 8 super-sandwich domain-containing protein n=1 Tax=Sanguibacter sp. Z1732 TaxID=3435412 RepID=UPI003D9CB604
MVDLSRRSLFALAGGTTLGVAVAGIPVRALANSADHELLLANYTAIFAGTATNNSHPAAAAKVEAIQGDGDGYAARLRPRSQWEDNFGVINNVRLGPENSSNGPTASGRLTSTFRVLGSIALATATPGSTSYGDITRQDAVIEALRWVIENYYDVPGDIYTGEGDKYGDWWDWEIGSPNQITLALVCLRHRIVEIDPSLMQQALDVMDSHLTFVPKFHTGANRADMTINYLIQGALVGDGARVVEGLESHLTVMATIDPIDPAENITDGFYPDGSFLQHGNVPYTATYGRNLLTRVMQFTQIMADTSLLPEGELTDTLMSWVRNSFAPVLYEGHFFEHLKGRVAARINVGYDDTPVMVEALTDLTRYVRGQTADDLRAYVKHLATDTLAVVNADDFASPVTPVTLHALLADTAVTPRDPYFPSGHATFNLMERDVHARTGYRFTIARSSERIGKYETMSGANPRPWFQGEGAYYLYLTGQNHPTTYGGEYLHVVDPTMLAGVTAQVGESRERTGSSPWGTNAHSGGASVDGFGTSSMTLSPEFNLEYVNPDGCKSWFMFEGVIIVLAADLTESNGRDLRTSVDTRLSTHSSSTEVSWTTKDGVPGSGPSTRSACPTPAGTILR